MDGGDDDPDRLLDDIDELFELINEVAPPPPAGHAPGATVHGAEAASARRRVC